MKFRFQSEVCDGCHDVLMMSINYNDIVILNYNNIAILLLLVVLVMVALSIESAKVKL